MAGNMISACGKEGARSQARIGSSGSAQEFVRSYTKEKALGSVKKMSPFFTCMTVTKMNSGNNGWEGSTIEVDNMGTGTPDQYTIFANDDNPGFKEVQFCLNIFDYVYFQFNGETNTGECSFTLMDTAGNTLEQYDFADDCGTTSPCEVTYGTSLYCE